MERAGVLNVLYTQWTEIKTQHVKFWSHVSWAEIKDPRHFPYAQKAYFSKRLCTICQYVQPASQPPTMCNHASHCPGPPHPAFSPAGSSDSETSHPGSWWIWGVFMSVIKPFCGEKHVLIGWALLPCGWPSQAHLWLHPCPVMWKP